MIATSAGLRLAPFYDLMCTRVYSGLGAHFAFSIGGESEPGRISHEHIISLAQALDVTPRYLIAPVTVPQPGMRSIPRWLGVLSLQAVGAGKFDGKDGAIDFARVHSDFSTVGDDNGTCDVQAQAQACAGTSIL